MSKLTIGNNFDKICSSNLSLSLKQYIANLTFNFKNRINDEFKKAEYLSKFFPEQDRESFISFIEEQKKISIERYFDLDNYLVNPISALKEYIKLYIKRKTNHTTKRIIEKWIMLVDSKCKTRGHCLGNGFIFSYNYNSKSNGEYQTFDKKLIDDLTPSWEVYLSVYSTDAYILIRLKRGLWNCG